MVQTKAGWPGGEGSSPLHFRKGPLTAAGALRRSRSPPVQPLRCRRSLVAAHGPGAALLYDTEPEPCTPESRHLSIDRSEILYQYCRHRGLLGIRSKVPVRDEYMLLLLLECHSALCSQLAGIDAYPWRIRVSANSRFRIIWNWLVSWLTCSLWSESRWADCFPARSISR